MGRSTFSLLRAAIVAISFFRHAAADSINPNSRLAAFALRINDVNGDNVMGPHVLYQSTDGTIREIYWAQDHKWRQGGFQSDAKPRVNTPLAVVSAPSVNVATTLAVMYVDDKNNLVTRVYDPKRKTWFASRVLTSNIHPDSPSIAAYLDNSNTIHVWIQKSDNNLYDCSFDPTSTGGCSAATLPWPSPPVPGTNIAAFWDAGDYRHMYYQGNQTANPIQETLGYPRDGWGFGTHQKSAVLGSSMAACSAYFAKGKSVIQRSHFFALNSQIMNQLTWSRYDVEDTVGCDGWCLPISIVQTASYKSGLACATGGREFKDDIRVYFINSSGGLSELVPGGVDKNGVGAGFGVSQNDLLSLVV